MPWSDIDLIVLSRKNNDLSIDAILSQIELRLKVRNAID